MLKQISKRSTIIAPIVQMTCFEYIKILSNSRRSANAATTFGVALALIYIFRARSLSTVYEIDKEGESSCHVSKRWNLKTTNYLVIE